MPWLIQEQDVSHSSEALLFVHIPRTGGTSLTSDYKVPSQSRRYLCCCQKLLITYFFYRYRLLEKSNFPMKSYENLYVVCSWIVAIVLGILFSISHRVQGLRDHSLKPLDCVHIGACYMPYIMAGSAFITHCLSTYVFTAPSLRFDVIRRFYLWFWHLTGAYSNEVLGGTNKNGFLMHLTTEEMLRYGYITSEQLERVSSFGIVRNPYARMVRPGPRPSLTTPFSPPGGSPFPARLLQPPIVATTCALQVSMYMYNRFTQAESFKAYVRRSYRAYQDLNDRGRWGAPRDGEWEVFCHRLPMHLFTHDGARQLVGHVVRMEDFSVIIDPSRGKVGPRCEGDTGLIQQWRPGPLDDPSRPVRSAAVAYALRWQPMPDGPDTCPRKACRGGLASAVAGLLLLAHPIAPCVVCAAAADLRARPKADAVAARRVQGAQGNDQGQLAPAQVGVAGPV